MTFCDLTIYNDNPLLIRLYTELDLLPNFDLRRVWHADRGRLLLRTPGPVPLGLAYVLLVETNPFPNLSLFYRTMLFEYPSVLSRFCFQQERNPRLFDVPVGFVNPLSLLRQCMLLNIG